MSPCPGHEICSRERVQGVSNPGRNNKKENYIHHTIYRSLLFTSKMEQ